MNDIDKSVKEDEMKFTNLESRKLESEIQMNMIQSQKLSIEAKEIEKRINQKWFNWRILMQSAVGGIVGSALLAAWLVGYFNPVLSAKHEIAKLENEELKIEAQKQKRENEEIQKQLQDMQSTFEEQLKSTQNQNETLQKTLVKTEERAKSLKEKLENLSKKINILAKNQITEDKKKQYTQIVEETNKEVEALQAQISQLNNEKTKTKAHTDRIVFQIENLPKIPPRIYIHIRKEEQRDKANDIGLKLQKAGFSVPGIERLVNSGPPSNQLRFFKKSETDEAVKIVDFLTSKGLEIELTDLSMKYETSSAIRPRHYELWFSPIEFLKK